MIFGAILAGGIGSRMNISEMPKQFLDLGGKPIIIHTLEKFLMCGGMEHIYLGVNEKWILHMKDLVEKFVSDQKDRIHIVAGGADRNSTIMNIIQKIEKDFGESEEHFIITHDSVRPFVTERILRDNIEGVLKFDACDTVVGASDTIVMSEDGEIITEIPNRSKMYQGQTPQSFRMNLLKRLYTELTDDEKSVLTDACKICVVRHVPVHLVQGEVSNLKITTVSDYKVAQAMVGGNVSD